MSWLSSWIGKLLSKDTVAQIEHFGEEILKYFIPDTAAILQAAAKTAISAAEANGGDWMAKLKFASDSLVSQFPTISRAVINSAINDVYLAATAPKDAPAPTVAAKAAAAVVSA